MSVTRVGFEPDLAGLKDQQPHQKSNEPYWLCRCAPLAQLLSMCFFASNAFSGLGGARTLLSDSSGQRYTVSATSPSACNTLEIVTKKPGVTCGNTGFANVCFVRTAECYLRYGCPFKWKQGSIFAFCNTILPSYPLNRSVLSRIEVMISYPVIDCFSDSSSRLVACTGR